MRTSFHHQPEAQHPIFQLSTSWQADYPIFRGDCVAKLFCPSERAVALWQRVRRSIGKPRKVTRKKPAKNAMSSASERPFQSFLSLRASEIHWPSGWSLFETVLEKISCRRKLLNTTGEHQED